ncbi:MAG: CBS domain-containing protein [Deltaproteobacteria bacterium]|nr:CBS domain-containing protein [Deltaproteobacteria bacterium]
MMNIKSSHISLAGKWATYYILIGFFSALGKISSGDFAILPVINPKDGTVLGIISRSDILRTLHRSISRQDPFIHQESNK